MKTKRWMSVILCLSVLATGVMSLSGCGTNKAYIAVDEKGTKASAATAVETVYTALEEGVYKVTLDRPFAYAIIDDATGLPIFIGTVTDIGK